MNKEELLKNLFQLSKEEILDIGEIINGYKERVNKSPKDTLLMRCMFMAGFHKTSEMYNRFNITKDNKLVQALNYETTNIKGYLELKSKLNIDDDLFNKILQELESNNDSINI